MESFLKLLLAALTAAGSADLTLPKQVAGNPGELIQVTAITTSPTVKWVSLDPGLALVPGKHLKDTRTALAIAQTAGSYRLLAYGSISGQPTDPVITSVVIGPPTPTPGPGPAPVPPPAPAPIAGDGFRVLLLYDTAKVSSLPAAQQEILFAGSIRDYLNQKAVKGSSGLPDWRFWDASIDASQDSKAFQDALKLPRTQLPWIIVSDGKTGFTGPLPASVDDALALLKKYGG